MLTRTFSSTPPWTEEHEGEYEERTAVTTTSQKIRKKKITVMVQLIGNFDFAALCLPTVPWGKSTRKMQFFRKVL